jgi:hypothetical protein
MSDSFDEFDTAGPSSRRLWKQRRAELAGDGQRGPGVREPARPEVVVVGIVGACGSRADWAAS